MNRKLRSLIMTLILIEVFLFTIDYSSDEKVIVLGQVGTSVGGILLEDTTWVSQEGPYNFVDNISVDSDVTLTIEPGVLVNFGPWTLVVEGTLVSRGNETHKIIFKSEEEPLGNHPESRIAFTENSQPWDETSEVGCIIEFAEFNCTWGATNSAYATIGGGILKIANSVIYSDWHGGIDINGGIVVNNMLVGGWEGVRIQNGLVSNNKFENVKHAVTIENGLAANNTIIGGGHGISTVNGSILYNVFKDLSYTGVHLTSIMLDLDDILMYYPKAIGNLIMNCHTGINIWGSVAPFIVNNTIVGNLEGISFADSQFYPETLSETIIHNNFQNREYNVRVSHEDPRVTINMTDNWWGTTNSTLIDQKIFDQNDNNRLCLVEYLPVLQKSNPSAPPFFTISASPGADGLISPSGSIYVEYGGDQTFIVTPNSGYQITNVIMDGIPTTSPYTFFNVVLDGHTISATFEQIPTPTPTPTPTVTPTPTASPTLTPEPTPKVEFNFPLEYAGVGIIAIVGVALLVFFIRKK